MGIRQTLSVLSALVSYNIVSAVTDAQMTAGDVSALVSSLVNAVCKRKVRSPIEFITLNRNSFKDRIRQTVPYRLESFDKKRTSFSTFLDTALSPSRRAVDDYR